MQLGEADEAGSDGELHYQRRKPEQEAKQQMRKEQSNGWGEEMPNGLGEMCWAGSKPSYEERW